MRNEDNDERKRVHGPNHEIRRQRKRVKAQVGSRRAGMDSFRAVSRPHTHSWAHHVLACTSITYLPRIGSSPRLSWRARIGHTETEPGWTCCGEPVRNRGLFLSARSLGKTGLPFTTQRQGGEEAEYPAEGIDAGSWDEETYTTGPRSLAWPTWAVSSVRWTDAGRINK